ncbi:MAG: hypothetical protein HKN12_00930, partial [Gemmatimonadetes bacterium]|nr:hypothetical protein [Gemmatimonadota bacterium]
MTPSRLRWSCLAALPVWIVGTAWLAGTAAATTFVAETVVTEPVSDTSLARDSNGNPHVAYFIGHPAYDLKYAVRLGGVWSSAVVDSGGVFGSGVNLTLDATDTPHISYATDGPWYATQVGGVWAVEQIEAVGVSATTSVVVDAQGQPHVAYAGSAAGVRHAVKVGGVWQITVVDSAASWGPSLAIDAAGNAHVGYAYSSGPLRYAYETTGGWMREAVVETPGSFFDGPSLGLDSQGKPHLAYMANFPDYNQCYASRQSGIWTHEVVDSTGLVGWYNSLALTTADEPRIAYTGSGSDLLYASRTGTTWSIETADPVSGTGDYNSLVLDAADRPHISYRDFPGQRVVYATEALPTAVS